MAAPIRPRCTRIASWYASLQQFHWLDVSKSHDGLSAFNVFIYNEYAPRGRHAFLITRPRTTWWSRRQLLANPLIRQLVILGWLGAYTSVYPSLAQGKLRFSNGPVWPAGRGIMLQCPLATISIHQGYIDSQTILLADIYIYTYMLLDVTLNKFVSNFSF